MTMKYCKGCGKEIQNIDKDLQGYSPNLENDLCMRCYKAKHYGEITNDFTIFNQEYWLNKISKTNDEILLIIDVLNPYETLIKGINDFIREDKLTLVINKIDLLPKSISNETIIDWIYEISKLKKIKFKQLVLVSSQNYWNIDTLYNYITSLESNVSLIGYTNVGKSSIVNKLFASQGREVLNLITNSIGTTREPIELKLENTKVFDYPGFILEGSYQNLLSPKEISKFNSKKEIKVINYQLSDEQIIKDNFDKFYIKVTPQEKCGIQFMISNDVKLSRHKSSKIEINKEYKEVVINPLETFDRQDIIISGIGIITFKKSQKEKITLYVPKEIKINVLKSIFERNNWDG